MSSDAFEITKDAVNQQKNIRYDSITLCTTRIDDVGSSIDVFGVNFFKIIKRSLTMFTAP